MKINLTASECMVLE